MRARGLRRQELADGVRRARPVARAADRVAAAAGRRATPALAEDLRRARLRRRAGRRRASIDGQPFEWIADADSRLGPVLEAASTAATTGCRSRAWRRSTFEAPEDLRDCVWMPAHLHVRQRRRDRRADSDPLSRARRRASDGAICLARKTDWAGRWRRALARPRPARPRHRRRRARPDGGAHRSSSTTRRSRCRGGVVAELTSQERLQPALLDRLTDDEPATQHGAARGARAAASSSCAKRCCATWRGCSTPRGWSPIRRVRPDEVALWTEAPHARRSVLNFGLPALSGITAVVARQFAGLERRSAGHPRLRAAHRPEDARGRDRRSTPALDSSQHHAASRSSGQLWAQPVPLELLLSHRGRPRDRQGGAIARPAQLTRGCAMDPRLLHYYNLELQHLREMGAEFAQRVSRRSPARLGMDGLEVADPYVERLLEGVAFLAARVQLKLDAEFPRFTQALLEIIYPELPGADAVDAGGAAACRCRTTRTWSTASRMPRGSALHGRRDGAEPTACEFRTAHDVTLWPLEVVVGEYFLAPDLPLTTLPLAAAAAGGLRIRLRAPAGCQFSQLDARPAALLPRRPRRRGECACTSCASARASACWSAPPGRGADAGRSSSPPAACGRSASPTTRRCCRSRCARSRATGCCRSTSRFRSASGSSSCRGLAPALAQTDGQRARDRASSSAAATPRSRASSTPANFALFCTPAINLFPSGAPIDPRRRGRDTSTTSCRPHAAAGLRGLRGRRRRHGCGDDSERAGSCRFYAAPQHGRRAAATALLHARREPRLLSDRGEARRAALELHRHRGVPLAGRRARGAVPRRPAPARRCQMLCTNRDLPLQMPIGQSARPTSRSTSPRRSQRSRIVGGPGAAVAPLRRRRDRVARDQPSVAQLPVAASTATPAAGRGGAARSARALSPPAPTSARSGRSKACGRCSVEPVVRRLPVPGPIALRPRPRDHA